MSEWLPIELAPKDGTYILTWDGKDVNMGHWLGNEQGEWVTNEYEYPIKATHWMPLPEPPARSSEGR